VAAYRYKCEICGFINDVNHSVEELDTHKEICPMCEHEMFRPIGAVGFQLKGQGFHVNDYPKPI